MAEEQLPYEYQSKRGGSCVDGAMDAQAVNLTELDSFSNTLH